MEMIANCVRCVREALNEAAGRAVPAQEFAALATDADAVRYLTLGLPGFRDKLPEWSYERTFHHDWLPTVLRRFWRPRFVGLIETRPHAPGAYLADARWIDEPGDHKDAVLKAAARRSFYGCQNPNRTAIPYKRP